VADNVMPECAHMPHSRLEFLRLGRDGRSQLLRRSGHRLFELLKLFRRTRIESALLHFRQLFFDERF